LRSHGLWPAVWGTQGGREIGVARHALKDAGHAVVRSTERGIVRDTQSQNFGHQFLRFVVIIDIL
jgi:hypothetical protein